LSRSKLLHNIGYLLTLFLLVQFFYSYSDQLKELHLNLFPAIIGISFGMLVLLIRAIAFHVIFVEIEKRAPTFLSSLIVTAKATLLNQVYPTRVGSLLLIHEIKKKGSFSFPEATAMYGGSMVVSLLLTLTLGLAGGFIGTKLPHLILTSLSIFIIITLVTLFFGAKLLSGKLLTLWNEMTFFLNRPCGIPFIMLSAIELIVMSFAINHLYMSLGVTVGFEDAMALMSIRNFSLLLALTPGAIGLSEITVGHVSNLLNHGGAAGITVALLLRVTLLGFSALLWFSEFAVKVLRR